MEVHRQSWAARIVLTWVTGSVCLLATAQSTPPQGQAVFRAAVDLIHLDVSVLDRSRRPVRGLKADDFTILEDGTPRPVAAFVELQLKEAPAVAAQQALVDKAPADIQTNEIARTPEGRLFVVILDDGMIPKEPQMAATAKKIAETAIDRLSPGDQMAVVFTVNSRGAQNFTSDKTKLLRAVDTFNPGYATHVLGWDNATYGSRRSELGNGRLTWMSATERVRFGRSRWSPSPSSPRPSDVKPSSS